MLARRLVAVVAVVELLELFKLLRTDGVMVGRAVAESGHPDGGPDHGEHTGGEGRAWPAEPSNVQTRRVSVS